VKRPLTSSLPLKSLALAAAVLAAAAPAAGRRLEYDRAAILKGEVWRIVTAHFVHCSAYHLTWNLLPLVAIGFLFEAELGRRFWPVLFGSCAAVGGGLLLLQPGLDSYRGLSGVLNGIWIAGALLAARRESHDGRRSLALLSRGCVLLDLGKIAFEAATGRPIFTNPAALAAEPIALAHVLGAAAGLCAALLYGGSSSGATRQAPSMYSARPACHQPSPIWRASSIARSGLHPCCRMR
jgi:rhomboid family GlyGly-CTERM serine protease